MKRRKIAAGVYEINSGGKTFRIEEVHRSEGFSGRAVWNISEVINGVSGPPFDATNTLREALEWLDPDTC